MKKLYPEESVQAIADAIREKINKNIVDTTDYLNIEWVEGDAPDGLSGYFKVTKQIGYFSKEIPMLCDGKTYEASFYRRALVTSSKSYFSLEPFDIDGESINWQNILGFNKNFFYLAKDLNPGDTIIHFTDLSKWDNVTEQHKRQIIFWGYTDSTGYTYPDGTYSRYVYKNYYTEDSSIDRTSNTITLNKAWEGNYFSAGTCVGQVSDGSMYIYIQENNKITDQWKKHTISFDTNYDPRFKYAKSLKLRLMYNNSNYAGISIREINVNKMKVEDMAEWISKIE
jgi:hypothetical protein